KCLADPTLQVLLDEIQVDAKLNFVEEPVEILEREFKKLKRSKIAIVKCSKRRAFVAPRREAWPLRYEIDQGVDSRRGISYRVDSGDFMRIVVIYGLL
ncbi:hypothetical protein Tco_0256040, partial [Tanacetum coccineum]